MLKQRREKQQQMELVIMEQMVPENHFLRKVDRAVDFSFIYDLCAPLYCADNGRPAIDPEILFRMLLVGYLYGIKSEARLEEEINYNIAYKWFCGLDLTDKAPDATTISQNRRRRFRDNNIAEEIFNATGGYLVGTLDRFNDGKRAEERDRVKHGMGGNGCE